MRTITNDEEFNAHINDYIYYYLNEKPEKQERLVNMLQGMRLEDITWEWAMTHTYLELCTLIPFLYHLYDSDMFDCDGFGSQRNQLEMFFRNTRYTTDDFTGTSPYSFIYVTNLNYKHAFVGAVRRLLIRGIDKMTNEFICKFIHTGSAYIGDPSSADIFEQTLKNKKGITLDYFSDETFESDYRIMDEYRNRPEVKCRTYHKGFIANLASLYIYVQDNLPVEERNRRFRKFNAHTLKYAFLDSCLRDGYEVVDFSPFDQMPKSDMWLIVPGKDSHYTDKTSIHRINFTPITNPILRDWCKQYFWLTREGQRMKDKIKRFYSLFKFAEIVDARVHGEYPDIRLEDALRFKSAVAGSGVSESAIANHLAQVRKFITFLFENEIIAYDENLLNVLFFREGKGEAYKDAFSKEEIFRLLKQYHADYEEAENPYTKQRYLLDYYVLMLMSLTEMRKETIVKLKCDCLVPTMTGKGTNEYKVVALTKTSKGVPTEYNVTRHVRNLIEEVKELTAEDREIADERVKGYLFIAPRMHHKQVDLLSERNLDKHIIEACQKLGIERKPLAAVRNYYQNAVSDFIIRNRLNDTTLETLSGHTKEVHERHYATHKIEELCQMLYGIRVGELELRGTVKEKEKISHSNTVRNGCGGCTSSKCDLDSNLDCLMCSKFVTTLSCIPYFEKEIEKIDKSLEKQEIRHEAEFLITKKKLLVAYLQKLLVLKEELNYAGA